jgi:hypothetical protein
VQIRLLVLAAVTSTAPEQRPATSTVLVELRGPTTLQDPVAAASTVLAASLVDSRDVRRQAGPLVANSRIPQQDRRVANTAVGSMAAANTTASKSNETASGYKGGGASAPSPFRYANSLKIAVRRPRILSCNKTCSKSIFSE